MMEPRLNLDRFRGCLIGLALGDALGAPYEFDPAPKVDGKFHRGYFGTDPGDGTDDSALAYMLGQSLLAKDGLVGYDYLSRLAEWVKSNPPDVGNQTKQAARAYELTGTSIKDDEDACGNGSLMACAALGLFYAGQGIHAARAGENFSSLTHPSSRSKQAVSFFVQSISRLVVDPRTPPPCEAQVRVPKCFAPTPDAIGLVTWCAALAYQASDRCELAMDAFPQLLWVIEQGGDTDTNAAVAGALLGARFGMGAWPTPLVDKLVQRDSFWLLADMLFDRVTAQMAQ